MSDAKRSVVAGLSEHIDELFETNLNFNALCREYGEVTEALSKLNEAEGEGEIKRLQKRRRNINQGMLAMMQANLRV